MSLSLGQHRNGPHISALYDTGAALTTGYLPHHMFVKLRSPEIMHSYEAFDGDKPFDPIKLLGAIDNPMTLVQLNMEYCQQLSGILLLIQTQMVGVFCSLLRWVIACLLTLS